MPTSSKSEVSDSQPQIEIEASLFSDPCLNWNPDDLVSSTCVGQERIVPELPPNSTSEPSSPPNIPDPRNQSTKPSPDLSNTYLDKFLDSNAFAPSLALTAHTEANKQSLINIINNAGRETIKHMQEAVENRVNDSSDHVFKKPVAPPLRLKKMSKSAQCNTQDIIKTYQNRVVPGTYQSHKKLKKRLKYGHAYKVQPVPVRPVRVQPVVVAGKGKVENWLNCMPTPEGLRKEVLETTMDQGNRKVESWLNFVATPDALKTHKQYLMAIEAELIARKINFFSKLLRQIFISNFQFLLTGSNPPETSGPVSEFTPFSEVNPSRPKRKLTPYHSDEPILKLPTLKDLQEYPLPETISHGSSEPDYLNDYVHVEVKPNEIISVKKGPLGILKITKRLPEAPYPENYPCEIADLGGGNQKTPGLPKQIERREWVENWLNVAGPYLMTRTDLQCQEENQGRREGIEDHVYHSTRLRSGNNYPARASRVIPVEEIGLRNDVPIDQEMLGYPKLNKFLEDNFNLTNRNKPKEAEGSKGYAEKFKKLLVQIDPDYYKSHDPEGFDGFNRLLEETGRYEQRQCQKNLESYEEAQKQMNPYLQNRYGFKLNPTKFEYQDQKPIEMNKHGGYSCDKKIRYGKTFNKTE